MAETNGSEQSATSPHNSISCRISAGFAILGIGIYISFIVPYISTKYGSIYSYYAAFYSDVSLLLQLSAIISSAAAPLLFSAPRIPKIKRFVRPTRFEDGWENLITTYKLNRSDRGFKEVLNFIGNHSGSETGDQQRDVIASDHGIDDISESEMEIEELVEEIRIRKRDLEREAILLCYDEETEGPAGEREKTPNHGFTKPNIDDVGDDWRWFAPVLAIEHNASAYISGEIDRWAMYGGIAIAISVILQILSLIFD